MSDRQGTEELGPVHPPQRRGRDEPVRTWRRLNGLRPQRPDKPVEILRVVPGGSVRADLSTDPAVIIRLAPSLVPKLLHRGNVGAMEGRVRRYKLGHAPPQGATARHRRVVSPR